MQDVSPSQNLTKLLYKMTELWNRHFGHGQIWEHLEILVCLIKLSKEWKCNGKGCDVCTEMHTVLKLEMMPLENEEPK